MRYPKPGDVWEYQSLTTVNWRSIDLIVSYDAAEKTYLVMMFLEHKSPVFKRLTRSTMIADVERGAYTCVTKAS